MTAARVICYAARSRFPSSVVRNPSRTFWIAAACFLVSGAAALLYEVVWMRHLGVVFGHTVHAVTTVLACYMAGLALGSVLAGRRADRLRRPLRAYAAVEAAVGLYCLLTPLLFRGTDALYASLYAALAPGALGSGLLHFALAALVLLPPTTLMGATLPILSRAVVDGRGVPASQVGALYAINTWGAVAGTAATGFLLLPAIGLSRTVWLGVALNLGVAGLAALLDRRVAAAARERPDEVAAPDATAPEAEALAPSPARVRVALAGIGISGAASMAYEIAWTRALSLTLGSSTYAFSAMLTTFLAGLALGAAAAARLLRRQRTGLAAFGLVEIGIGLLGVLLLPLFGRLPEALLLTLGRTGVTHGAVLAAQFCLGFALMIGPTLLVGTTFPLVIAALRPGVAAVGRHVGLVYGANTVGTIVGSMLAGFALIPAFGIQATVRIAAAANVAVGIAVLAAAPALGRRVRIAAAAAVGAFALALVALPRWDPRIMTVGVPVYAAEMVKAGVKAIRESSGARELLLYREGISTTVAVVRSPTAISLSVNGKTDASNTRDMATQLLLGHLGPLLQPEAPRSALVIGLASGITAGAVAQHPVERIDVAELEPAMIEASRFFARENRDVLADPRVRVLAGDGRQILAAAPAPYDLIVSEPSNPWIAGVASLFTREFYQSARRKLSERGVMVQWLQTYSIFDADVRMVVRTFQEVFPHVSIWTGSLGDVLLVATPERVAVDLGAIRARLAASPGLRDDFARFGWGPEEIVFRFFLGEDDARRFAEGARVNTDDLPYLEFSAPLALYAGGAFENKAAMRSFRREDRPALLGVEPGRLAAPDARLRAATLHWTEARPEDADLEVSALPPGPALDPELRVARARLLFLLARFDEAWVELSALSRLRPDDPVVRRYFRALTALADPPAAKALEAAMAPYPAGRWYADPALLGELLLRLSADRGDDDVLAVATEQLEAALRLQPGKTSLLGSYGIALATAGRLDDADATFRRALEIEPRDARIHFNVGTLHERRGNAVEAARAYAQAVRFAPRWEPPRQRLAALGIAPP
jgi:spermidine synthase